MSDDGVDSESKMHSAEQIKSCLHCYLTDEQTPSVIKKGWMRKQGGSVANWKQRFFYITAKDNGRKPVLTYHKKPLKPAISELPILHAKVSIDPTGGLIRFQHTQSPRVYLFRADTRSKLLSWKWTLSHLSENLIDLLYPNDATGVEYQKALEIICKKYRVPSGYIECVFHHLLSDNSFHPNLHSTDTVVDHSDQHTRNECPNDTRIHNNERKNSFKTTSQSHNDTLIRRVSKEKGATSDINLNRTSTLDAIPRRKSDTHKGLNVSIDTNARGDLLPKDREQVDNSQSELSVQSSAPELDRIVTKRRSKREDRSRSRDSVRGRNPHRKVKIGSCYDSSRNNDKTSIGTSEGNNKSRSRYRGKNKADVDELDKDEDNDTSGKIYTIDVKSNGHDSDPDLATTVDDVETPNAPVPTSFHPDGAGKLSVYHIQGGDHRPPNCKEVPSTASTPKELIIPRQILADFLKCLPPFKVELEEDELLVFPDYVAKIYSGKAEPEIISQYPVAHTWKYIARLMSQPWFANFKSNEEIAKILEGQNIGSFYVRFHDVDIFLVTVLSYKGIEHALIYYSYDGFSFKSAPTFSSLYGLLQHYTRYTCPLGLKLASFSIVDFPESWLSKTVEQPL